MSAILHPGLELHAKIKASGFSQHVIATNMGLAPSHFSELLHGKRPLTAKICLALQAATGLNARQWLYKQADYELALVGGGEELPEAEPLPEPDAPTEEAAPIGVRVKAEAYEYRIYELEMEYMLALADSPEGKAAWESCRKVKANYARDYPGRPLQPRPREQPAPPIANVPEPPAKKPRKPYTRKAQAAA